MEVTCECGVPNVLSDSCDDRSNWVAVTQLTRVEDEVKGTTMQDIPVAYTLQWLCPCGILNTITEEV